MAPSKKKKKPTSNPARGFATVSQPSKPREAIDETDNDLRAEVTQSNTPQGLGSAPGHAMNVQGKSSADITGMSSEQFEAHLEDAELQHLLDLNSARCKQDAKRQIFRLKIERRQLRSQAHKVHLWADSKREAVDTILQQDAAPHDQLKPRNGRLIDDENHTIARLWTLYMVLVELNFPDVETALHQLLVYPEIAKSNTPAEYIWGLQETLNWYATNGLEADLPDYESNENVSKIALADATNDTANDSTTNEVRVDSDQGDLPSKKQAQSDYSEGNTEPEHMSPIPSSDSDDDDPSSLVTAYLLSRRLLYHTEKVSSNSGGSPLLLNTRKLRLQRRLERIQHDILFDQVTADELWKQEYRQLEIDSSRLEKTKRTAVPEDKQIDDEVVTDGESMLGDMFEANDIHAACETVSDITTELRLINFGKVTGLSPRKLLEECSRNLDSRSALSFSSTSTMSKSWRRRLALKWHEIRIIDQETLSIIPFGINHSISGSRLVLDMVSVATASSEQAEAYLSTIALFLLINSGFVERKQVTRLTTAWRDVYADLSQKLQLQVNENDKQLLRMLRKLISESQSQDHELQNITSKHTSKLFTGQPQLVIENGLIVRLSPDVAKAIWASRATSAQYQAALRNRRQLPIFQDRARILEHVENHGLIIICAETGAGKSTQVPSYLLEDRLCNGIDSRILVTQPRRISAISIARRVSHELGEKGTALGTDDSLVGFAIRLESKTSKSTRITFATTGVLLRMIETSPDLDNLDILILDEVHERTMEIDLLFIGLKAILKRRKDLKVILMSATVDADKFSRYFDGAPIVWVAGRTFPVETFYLEDAVEETAGRKTSKSLPDDQDYAEEDWADGDHNRMISMKGLEQYSLSTRTRLSQMNEYKIDHELIASLAESIALKPKFQRYSRALLIFMPGIAEMQRLKNVLLGCSTFTSGCIIHLLHSSFFTDDLEAAFGTPPPGHRKIVIATNIAETGITIPDITAVIDTCKEKVMRFDERRQLSRLTESFISRSSARQRRGRAARVQDGLCFHLVTRHRFEELMPEQTVPEMLRLSLQDAILRMKIWNLGSIDDTFAAAIDPPSSKNVRRAVEKLKDAGALSVSEELTALGEKIARLPLEVVLSKLVFYGIVFRCLDAALTIVASLSSKSPFQIDKSGQLPNARLAFSRGDSDLLTTLNAYQSWRKARAGGSIHAFCRKYRLNDQNLCSIEDQKIQILVYLVDAGLLHLNVEERGLLNRARGSASQRNFFICPNRYNDLEHDSMLQCIIAMSFYPKVLLREGKGWKNVSSNQNLSLSRESVNRAVERGPTWLCYYEAMQARSGPLNALETSRVPELAILTMLGSAEIKFYSGVVVLDSGKLRFSVRRWKELAAVKVLRVSLSNVLTRYWSSPGLSISHSDRQWIELLADLLSEMNKVPKRSGIGDPTKTWR